MATVGVNGVGFFAAVRKPLVSAGVGWLGVRVVASALHSATQRVRSSFTGPIGEREHLGRYVEHRRLYAFFIGHSFFKAGFAHVAHGRRFELHLFRSGSFGFGGRLSEASMREQQRKHEKQKDFDPFHIELRGNGLWHQSELKTKSQLKREAVRGKTKTMPFPDFTAL